MVAQVSPEALRVLRMEMEKAIKGSYGAMIINRLKNENPHYAFIGNALLGIVQAKFGGEARDFARDVVGICYRILELSERYPDQARAFAQILLTDPPLSGNNEEIQIAQDQTNELLKKLMLHH